MFRRLSGISLMVHSIDKVWDTYGDVLGLKARENIQLFEKGRYRQRTFRIGETALWLLEPLDGPKAPGPGGGMARFLERRGEGLYMITVGLGDEPDRYAKRLEAKGVKIYWDVPDSGVELTSAPRPNFQMTMHPLIHPRSVHGVLWEMGRHVPGRFRQAAPASSPFKRVMAISMVCQDADAAVKTYTDVLEQDPLLSSTVFEKGGYKENTIGMGDIALEFQQPLAGPDAKSEGGNLARSLKQYGEGLYGVTVDVKDPEQYAKSLDAKGVKVQRVAVEKGKTLAGRSKAPAPTEANYFIIDPSRTHGVPWKFARFGMQTEVM